MYRYGKQVLVQISVVVLLVVVVMSQVCWAQANLVVNGSFEQVDANGFPLNWEVYWGSGGRTPNLEAITKADGAPDGERYTWLYDEHDVGAVVFYSDPIMVKPGGKYTLSVISKDKTGTISLRLRTFNKANAGPTETAAIVQNLAGDIVLSTGDWSVSSSVVTIPANAVMARVLVYTSKATPGSVAIDKVVLTEGEVIMESMYDQVADRYLKPVFSQVVIHDGIHFRSAVDLKGVNQQLLLDVYEPKDDTQELRPAILWLHGGGLKGGDRKQGYIGTVSNEFAKRGYVCISADYRIGTNQDDFHKILENSVTDGIAAYNWVLENAAKYRIDTQNVFIGGGSAGGWLVVNIGVVDDDSRGAYDKSRIKGIINLWGSPKLDNYLGKISKSVPPMFIIHGTADTTVPYYLSQYLSDELTKVGVDNVLYPLPGLEHTPASEMATILEQSSQFLYKLMFPNGR
jgi:acetyl esterase/lipase